jgi:rubrerythrin
MSNLLEDHEVVNTVNSSCGKGQQSVLQCFGRRKASDRSTSHVTDEDGESSSSSRDSSVVDCNKTAANSFSGVFKVAAAEPAAKRSPSVQPTSQLTPATAVFSEGDANKLNAVHSFGLPSFDNEQQTEDSLTELSNSRCSSETIYSCPICNTVVDCDSLASLNKHIDECLAYSTINNSVHGNVLPSNDYPNFADSPRKDQGHSIPGSVSASSKAASSASSATSSSIASKKNSEKTHANSSSTNLDSSAPTSSSAAEKTADGMCPVCGKLVLAESLNDFNEHLDFCLNRSLIQKIVNEENSRSTSATPRRLVN